MLTRTESRAHTSHPTRKKTDSRLLLLHVQWISNYLYSAKQQQENIREIHPKAWYNLGGNSTKEAKVLGSRPSFKLSREMLSANTSHLPTHCWIKDWRASPPLETANHNLHVVKNHKISTMAQEIWRKGVIDRTHPAALSSVGFVGCPGISSRTCWLVCSQPRDVGYSGLHSTPGRISHAN